MAYFLFAILGLAAGGFAVYMLVEQRRKKLDEQKRQQDEQAERIQGAWAAIHSKHEELQKAEAAVQARSAELRARIVSFKELEDENAILKQDLRNLDVSMRKLHLDCRAQKQSQEEVDQRAKELAKLYIKESEKWIERSLTPSNLTTSRDRLKDVIERCRSIGYDIPPTEENERLSELRAEFERVVRAAFEREEQVRIRAQIREEQLREKEIEREVKEAERESDAIRQALVKALAEAHDQHSAEVEYLKQRLAEAEAKAQRAISQAQLTKSGNVYVISNIGSFGEGVFKVGMTRRLEPLERIRELGDASVPFPFDIHMMIASDDAPALENAVHRALHKSRINRTNPRKEFFKTEIDFIYEIVKKNHADVQYVANAEALEYHQSLSLTDEDQEVIDQVFEEVDDEEPVTADDL